MARSIQVTQQKLAEKLTILNDRGVGMLTRIYNIKKACGDPKSKPSFLSDKTLESAIKHIVRRFPNIDTRGSSAQLSAVYQIRQDITKSLSLYYYTFVDLLDFRDHVNDLLTIMDAVQVIPNIMLSYDLTKAYLDLVTTYVALLILLSRVDDRKAVLGLFNTAYEMTHGHSDSSFPRLGQMIVEYDPPLKKLSEEFVPHQKILSHALMSLQTVYARRNLTADEWRTGQVLSLLVQPAHMLTSAQTETTQCEYLSLETMERWILFGFLLIHPQLAQSQASKLFHSVLCSSWVVTLFRDEVLHFHAYIQQFFDSIKGYNKRVSEVKDCFNHAVQNAGYVHRERRKFLRSTLKELGLIMTEQPGLLGPKSLYVLTGLSFARDEVTWLLRHYDNPPWRPGSKKATHCEDLIDRQLPELLFHIEELRGLCRKYSQIFQLYYIQYLSGFDTTALNQTLQTLTTLGEEDSIILSSVCQQISNLSVKQVEEKDMFDLRGLRLDWFRLQIFASSPKGSINLRDHHELAVLMNNIVYHTKMVDFLDRVLYDVSDLSIFCFFSRTFEEQFHLCLEFPAQTRYIIAFPLLCSHFMNATHEICPEERGHIGERSINLVNAFLEEMAKEAKNIITTICDEQYQMSDRLLPKHTAPKIAEVVQKKNRGNKKSNASGHAQGNHPGGAPGSGATYEPGMESYRRTREDLSTMDKLHMALTELCFAINYAKAITVWEHTFAPREYLTQHLETRFNKALVGMAMFDEETKNIAKPSELLCSVRAYMSVLQSVENHAYVDITRVFNSVLLQQTQPADSHGEVTITKLYSDWYLNVLLRKVTQGQIAYSPFQRAFVTLVPDAQVPHTAEEYSDVNELRALAELIGPYGMRFMNENLMRHIAGQVFELKKIVMENREVLTEMRSNHDKPDVMRELNRRLQHVDNVLQRMTIIGVILSFRYLAQDALRDVLEDRIPFLLSSIEDFKEHVANGGTMISFEMASGAGSKCKIDPALVQALKQPKVVTAEGVPAVSHTGDEYEIACLLMVMIAVCLPRLARNEASIYKPALEAHANNIHCLAQAINALAGALFSLCDGHIDTEERLKEFLALASSSLLRLGQEADKEAIKNRESVYLLLSLIVEESPFLTMDLFESCFPYALLRSAVHHVYKTDHAVTVSAH